MLSTPLIRALAAERPSTGGRWNLPESDPHAQRQRRSRSEMVGGAQPPRSQIPYPLSAWPTNRRTVNTKEVLQLLWRFGTLCWASQPTDLTKGLGIPRESDPEAQWDWITRLPQGWGRWRLQTLRAQTKPCMHQSRLREKEQWLYRKPNQNDLLVLEGLLWRREPAGAHHRDRRTGSSCLGRPPLV